LLSANLQNADQVFQAQTGQPAQPEIFGIPFQGQTIIYAPLKRLAFMGNSALAGLIRDLVEGRQRPSPSPTIDQAIDFINKTNILAPDPPLTIETESPVYRPGCATLFMTNRCNLRCIYCYADAGREKPVNMPLGLALQAVDLVYENAVGRGLASFEIGFHGGGEPTLNWRVLTAAVAAAEKKSLKAAITMSSNGYYSAEKLAFILDHFTGLSLSFDGPPEIQNRQRPQKDGSASFRRVMRTIAAFDRRGFNYGIRMTMVPESLKQMPQAVAFLCRQTGVKQIQVEPAFARGRGKTLAVRAKEVRAFADAFKQAYEIAAAQGVSFFTPAPGWRGSRSDFAPPRMKLWFCCRPETFPPVSRCIIANIRWQAVCSSVSWEPAGLNWEPGAGNLLWREKWTPFRIAGTAFANITAPATAWVRPLTPRTRPGSGPRCVAGSIASCCVIYWPKKSQLMAGCGWAQPITEGAKDDFNETSLFSPGIPVCKQPGRRAGAL